MADIDTATIRDVCDDGGGFNYRQTVRVLCDEVDRLRARLAAVEAERDRRTSASYWPGLTAENDRLRTRLAEVEAELQFKINAMRSWRYRARRAEYNLKVAESRLATVRALCERNFNLEDWYEIDANDVAAIIEGRAVLAAADQEDDRGSNR